ncbi:MAG TPA: hypothetical protein VFU69_18175, partial [Ktedonobacterales bacterium]|nr:hypothetical protein [Ktedonobacterales bacterium]
APRLLTPCPDEPEQQVACHLYNASMRPPPLPAELSARPDIAIANAEPSSQKETAHESTSPFF